jgi:hypothetical protein
MVNDLNLKKFLNFYSVQENYVVSPQWHKTQHFRGDPGNRMETTPFYFSLIRQYWLVLHTKFYGYDGGDFREGA